MIVAKRPGMFDVGSILADVIAEAFSVGVGGVSVGARHTFVDGGGAAHHDCPRASFTNRQHRIHMPREHDVASHVHEGARVRLELR
jgi:hypothetical protein